MGREKGKERSSRTTRCQ